MSNLRVLVFPFLIISTLIFLWQFVLPMYNVGNAARKKIPELTSVANQENDLQQRTEKLFKEASASEADTTLAISAIPAEKEVKNLISQIDFVTAKSGLALEGINVEDTSESIQGAAATSIIPGKTEEYKKVNGSIQVKGGYMQFKLFLNELSKMSRLVNVESISVKNSSDQSGEASGRYELKFVVYYLPLATTEQVKSGLESREGAQ